MGEKLKSVSIKIEEHVLEKVKQVVEKTKQSIGGFVSIEIEKIADRKLKNKK